MNLKKDTEKNALIEKLDDPNVRMQEMMADMLNTFKLMQAFRNRDIMLDFRQDTRSIIRERIANFFVDMPHLVQTQKTYLLNVISEEVVFILANAFPEQKKERIANFFVKHIYTLHEVEPDEAMVEKFVSMFHDFNYGK